MNVSEENTEYSSIDGVLFDKDQMVLMYYPIGKTDKEYIIPDGTIYVYDSAFYIGSSGDFLSNLEFIVCPESLQTIGSYAFGSLKSLKTIKPGKGIKAIKEGAFHGCNALTDVYYEGSEDDWKNINIDGNRTYIVGSSNSYYDPLLSATIHFNSKKAEAPENNSTISASTIKLGETIDITADADGGTGGYKYKMLYKTADALGWQTIQNYSENDIAKFKPTKMGKYNIRVNVKDDNNMVTPKTFDIEVKTAAMENLSSISAEKITLGETINIIGAANGGTGDYKYQMVYKKASEAKWSTIQSYSTNFNANFKPKAATIQGFKSNQTVI